MNGIDNIIQRILDDAQAEADATLAQAREEADAIRRKYDQQIQKETPEILLKGTADAEQRKARVESAADLRNRQRLLAAKQELLDEAFRLALEKLCALPEEEYTALLVQLAAKAAETGRGELIFNQSDRARLGVKVAAAANDLLERGGKPHALTVSGETGAFRGGLVLKCGDVESNCTFETLVRLGRERLGRDAARILFD